MPPLAPPQSPAEWLAWACAGCAALPALLTAANLCVFRGPKAVHTPARSVSEATPTRSVSEGPGTQSEPGVTPRPPAAAPRASLTRRAGDVGGSGPPRLSLLIPARDEAGSIGECLHAALGSKGVDLEVVVLDDHSTDGTAEIVAAAAGEDPRVRLEPAPPLPAGWCGKQWACLSLARAADPSRDLFCFIDADVRLKPGALRAMCDERDRRGVDLLSGFPREICGTAWEAAVIPLIHFVLLGFLPIFVARRLRGPAWAAGCGQLFLTTRGAYTAVGGHGAVKASLHDGLKLPRAYRLAGRTTDVVDAADLATCRMYTGGAETFSGLAKNATEGVAAPGLIGFFTLVLGLGQVLPLPLLLAGSLGAFALTPTAATLLIAAAVLSYGTRAALARRYSQPWRGVILHPAGVAFFLAVQWYALGRKLLGKPAAWRGRTYQPGDAPAAPEPARAPRPAVRREPPAFAPPPRSRANSPRAGVPAAGR